MNLTDRLDDSFLQRIVAEAYPRLGVKPGTELTDDQIGWLQMQVTSWFPAFGLAVDPRTAEETTQRVRTCLRMARAPEPRTASAANNTPPDPYAGALRKIRGETTPPKAPAPPKDYEPPNPYTAAIEELKRSEQR